MNRRESPLFKLTTQTALHHRDANRFPRGALKSCVIRHGRLRFLLLDVARCIRADELTGDLNFRSSPTCHGIECCFVSVTAQKLPKRS